MASIDEVFQKLSERDASALANYTKLHDDYYVNGSVTLDCMGMAKYFFCAKAYPTCSDDSVNTIE